MCLVPPRVDGLDGRIARMTNTTSDFNPRFSADGTQIAGDRLLVATGRRVRVTARAAGKILQCRVVAENEGGSTPSAASPPLRVPR